MVKLRVSVGGSYTDLAIVNCNDELHPVEFDTPEFKGRAVVRIKDFVGITNDASEPILNSDYFNGRNRRFSLQVEGRFKREWDGQQVYFGTDFDRSVELPDGFELMLRVARYIDPVVKTSLTKDGKPWILSPLVSSINTMAAWHPQDTKLPSPPITPRPSMDMSRAFSMTENGVTGAVSSAWGFLGKLKRGNRSSVMSINSTTSNNENNGLNSSTNSRNNSSEQLDKSRQSNGIISPSPVPARAVSNGLQSITSPTTPQPETISSVESEINNDKNDEGMPLGQWRGHLEEDTTFFMPENASLSTSQRRKHFQTEQNRKDFVYKTDLVHGFEFFSPHMDFNTFDIRLGLSMNIRKYLAGQPVRYSCRTLDGETVFWVVQFELVD
ncbi:hypothetical protein BGZ51_003037 [Haplosporangium sp. Z 767]|nr:hypothetical protein BGZ50_005224 [Haplosporangium sp. Z 11]KAF9184914.1 hypothetical protein BGZ51_003037 [Haplosporangium sp. Z 767]